MNTATEAKPPNPIWTLTEGRALLEFAAFGILGQQMRKLPRGDGHPVIFLPGFLGSDVSTKPMRSLFRDLGYTTVGWGLGRNVKFSASREIEMREMIEHVHKHYGQKLSFVGWSLGGVFAREMAKQYPDYVRSVISLGSPISDGRRHSAVGRLFEAINGKPSETSPSGRFVDLEKAPPVPTTSILSKTDGIVAWRGSIQKPQEGQHTENILVPASHTGLGLNPLVMLIIADRLAQAEGNWAPFDFDGWREVVFKDPLSSKN